ncbi:MAG TPA: hypothetical protein VF637_16495 [Sphingomicrobium sp.]|jgi:hypothetical protein
MGIWYSDGAEGVNEVRAIIDRDMVTLCQTVEGADTGECVVATGGLGLAIADWFETAGRKVVERQDVDKLAPCF